MGAQRMLSTSVRRKPSVAERDMGAQPMNGVSPEGQH